MSNPAPLLATERLSIRAWQKKDLQSVTDICSDPDVMKHVGDGHCWSDAECLDFLVQEIQHQRQHGFCRWAVADRQEGSVIGFCGLVSRGDSMEMGWRLAAHAWGRGLASEAARAVLHYARETLRRAPIQVRIHPANRTSLRLAKKIGFQETSRCTRRGRELIILEASCIAQP